MEIAMFLLKWWYHGKKFHIVCGKILIAFRGSLW